MSDLTPSFSVNVDVTNPGQFFACCGLLELAHRLWPGAEGWFDPAAGAFSLCVADTNARLPELIDKIAHCPLQGLTQDQRTESEELERRKRELRKRGEELSEAEEQRRTELGKQASKGRITVECFQLVLDWWQDESTLVTWAGKQEIHKIAQAAQEGIKRCLDGGMPPEGLLDWHLVLRTPKDYQPGDSDHDKKVEPFYFDARRYVHPVDEGFSLDVQGAETEAYPATEFLCLVGLQRFRPRADTASKWSFTYWVWAHPLGVNQAAAVCSGFAGLPATRPFAFTLRFRDDQKRYKAFGFATPWESAHE